MKNVLSKVLSVWCVIFFLFVPLVHAQTDVSQITEPLNKIYDLVKAVISIVAILAITFAGAKFMFSGEDIKAREGAKAMVSYAIVGLVIIWVAPLMVSFLTAPA